MMGLLIVKERLPVVISPIATIFQEKLPYTENWGIYAKDARIGNFKVKLQEDNKDRYLLESELNIKVPIASEKIPISINSLIQFNNSAKLRHFNLEMLSDNYAINIEGNIQGTTLTLLNKNDISEKKYTLPWAEDIDTIGSGFLPFFYRQKLKVGDSFRWKTFNPLTQKKELVKANVERSTFTYRKGNFVNVLVVMINYANLNTEFWIDKNGYPVKIFTPWGWELINE